MRDHTYLILTSQTSTRGPIVGHEARNLDAQRVFLNSFENIVNRRVNIPEDIRRFQKTLQHAGSKVDYVIGEYIYMLPSDMNLRIGKVKNYNNKILISSPSFNIGTNLEVNLNERKDRPDVKSKEAKMVKTEPDVKPKGKEIVKTKTNIKFKQDVKMIKTETGMDKITYEEEKVALVLGITVVFTVWWMFK